MATSQSWSTVVVPLPHANPVTVVAGGGHKRSGIDHHRSPDASRLREGGAVLLTANCLLHKVPRLHSQDTVDRGPHSSRETPVRSEAPHAPWADVCRYLYDRVSGSATQASRSRGGLAAVRSCPCGHIHCVCSASRSQCSSPLVAATRLRRLPTRRGCRPLALIDQQLLTSGEILKDQFAPVSKESTQ